MIKSMTGYAAASVARDNFTVSVEIRSVNSRFLDLSLKVSTGHAELEDRIRSLISKRLERGRVEAKIHIENPAAVSGAYELDLPKARALSEALQRLNIELGLGSPPTLDLVVSSGGILKSSHPELDLEGLWPCLQAALLQALDGLDAMRLQEGGHVANDLNARLDLIAGCLEKIAQSASGLLPVVQEKLKERIAALTQGLVEIDPGRIAQEAAFLADRSDISEEIVRAESHLGQFRGIMNASEPAGRQLNFLLQELNREFNTMSSKIGNAAAAHLVVQVKSELEKIREQVQNIE